MKFPKLTIHNFLAITDAEINLSDRGLIAIQGDNKADTSANSNGCGKSSIADALSWCWFGVTARGVSGDDVINDDAKKDCYVRCEAVEGAITYTVTRYRKHKTGKNNLTIKSNDGLKEVDLTKGTDKLTQEVANTIIGCSLDVFNASIYAGQEKMPDLPAMTDKALKMLVEEAAGVTVLEEAYKKARERVTEAKNRLDRVETSLADAERQEELLRSHVSAAEAQIDEWDKNRDERQHSAKVNVQSIILRLRSLKEDIEIVDVAAIDEAIRTCDQKVAAVSGENATLGTLQSAAAAAQSKLYAANANVKSSGAARDAASLRAASVANRIGAPCSECGRPLTTAELGAAQEAANKLLRQAVESVQTAETEATKAQIEFDTAMTALNDFKAGMTDISAIMSERAVQEKKRHAYDALVSQQQLMANQAKTLASTMKAIGEEANPHRETVERLSKSHKDAVAAVKKAQELLVEENKNLAIEDQVAKVYSPAGVRAHILDEVTPFLNAQTTKYLSTLSDGNIEAVWSTLTPDKKGNLKERFAIDVTNATGGKSFKSFSGGEKRKARIAAAMALQDLVATRATKPIDLFIGDEIDDALDTSGLERLMTILEDKARERGTVLVISHNELRDFIRQILTVEKLPNKTTRVVEGTV